MALGGGTADSNIVFTSYYDDYYGGDTNADSNKQLQVVTGVSAMPIGQG
jgi:hypothetical protein